jgi:hypothetical protein
MNLVGLKSLQNVFQKIKKHGAVLTMISSPLDEHVMELEEFEVFEYTKPRKVASFNNDKSGRDLQFQKYTGIH